MGVSRRTIQSLKDSRARSARSASARIPGPSGSRSRNISTSRWPPPDRPSGLRSQRAHPHGRALFAFQPLKEDRSPAKTRKNDPQKNLAKLAHLGQRRNLARAVAPAFVFNPQSDGAPIYRDHLRSSWRPKNSKENIDENVAFCDSCADGGLFRLGPGRTARPPAGRPENRPHGAQRVAGQWPIRYPRFARSLRRSRHPGDPQTRRAVKAEVGKKFDGDFDVLYRELANHQDRQRQDLPPGAGRRGGDVQKRGGAARAPRMRSRTWTVTVRPAAVADLPFRSDSRTGTRPR